MLYALLILVSSSSVNVTFEIIIEAYVSGIDAFFYVDSDSVAEILSSNSDVNQEAERGSDKFEYELDRLYRVVNTEEPNEALWYFILQGFSEAGGFHGIKSKDLCATAQEALDASMIISSRIASLVLI
jgi:hypothetical protein